MSASERRGTYTHMYFIVSRSMQVQPVSPASSPTCESSADQSHKYSDSRNTFRDASQ
jgi:hypothetical protein